MDVKSESPEAAPFEEEEDIYGAPPPSTSKTPPWKRRKLNKTPPSAKSKSSSSSAVFSPIDSPETPASSISGSIRKVKSAIRGAKRKLQELDLDSDAEESEYEEPEEEAVEWEEEDDAASVAPTVSTESLETAVTNARTQTARRRGNTNRFRRGKRSQYERTNDALIEHHPELAVIWDELENAPQIKPVAVPQPAGLSLQLLPFQLEGLDWLLKQEQQERFGGGILADEMGMGKTIQTIALLLAEPRGKPNLVIAPTVALMQWKQEIETHTDNGLSVCLFYGANRSVTAKQMKEYDVVLTTCIPFS
jgi:DNA repair protein RAD16